MRKYVLYSLVAVAAIAIAVAVVGHLYLAPGGAPSDRGLAEPDPALLAYFEPDYEQSRDAFRSLAERLTTAYRGVERGAIAVPGQRDSDLTIDWMYIPAQAQPRRLLILTSGIHGAEGPAGSAVQRHFMTEVLPKTDLSRMGVLLVHALNPFGFRHMRRVTENNVDLNRNLDVTPALFALENPGYRAITGLLNPEQPVDLGSMQHRLFAERAVLLILQRGMAALRQAALQGQYEFAHGIYFGGHDSEPQQAELERLVRRIAPGHGAVMAIDLHTGYGERGTLHLYPNPPLVPRIEADTENVFAGHHIDWPQKDPTFYSTTGALLDWIGKLLDLEAQRYVPMVFEYGTLNSQTTTGALDSIHRMVLENQGWHHGHATPEDEAEVRRRFHEMFYPSSPRWRTEIVSVTAALWPGILERFGAL
ncbi:MAG TPA: M14 family metallopeptidase [Haliangium sp.]|nr:M14 family metallopeptidase [Haliangium sp.]